MRAGLKKYQKTAEIYFNEARPTITVVIHNTALKKRLTAYAGRWPDCCELVEDDSSLGRMTFEVAKGRFCFRLTAPYSVERREAARKYAKENHCADKLRSP